MTSDNDLLRHLRSALPPVDANGPSRDLWPSIVDRSHTPPRWAVLDLSAAAVVAGALLLFPQWFWILAYHL